MQAQFSCLKDPDFLMLHNGDAPVRPETLGSLHDTFHVRLVLLVWLAGRLGGRWALLCPRVCFIADCCQIFSQGRRISGA